MERRRKTPMLPFVAVASILGAVAGFSLALVLDLGSVKLKESPFSPDTGKRIAKGRDFGGAKELGSLSDTERAQFSQGLQLALAGAGPQARSAPTPEARASRGSLVHRGHADADVRAAVLLELRL